MHGQVEHAIQSPASWTSKVKEITVKSFAMNMNVRRPGYQLMTLSNSARARPTDGSSTVATQSCLLPYQIGVYLHLYVPLLLLTLGWLFVPKILKSWRTRRVSTAKGSKLPSHARSSSRKHSRNISRFTTESSDSDSGDEYGYGSSFTPAAEYSSYSYHTDEDGLRALSVFSFFKVEHLISDDSTDCRCCFRLRCCCCSHASHGDRLRAQRASGSTGVESALVGRSKKSGSRSGVDAVAAAVGSVRTGDAVWGPARCEAAAAVVGVDVGVAVEQAGRASAASGAGFGRAVASVVGRRGARCRDSPAFLLVLSGRMR